MTDLTGLGNTFVVRVGTESLPVLGSAEDGWRIVSGADPSTASYRYGSLDELLFALINLSVVTDAAA